MAGGVNIVQLRARTTPADDLGLYAVAMRLREMTAGHARFVVTGDVELAEKVSRRRRAAARALLQARPRRARFLRGEAPSALRRHVRPHRQRRGPGRARRGGLRAGRPGLRRRRRPRTRGGLTLLRKIKDAVQIPVIAFGGVQTPDAGRRLPARGRRRRGRHRRHHAGPRPAGRRHRPCAPRWTPPGARCTAPDTPLLRRSDPAPAVNHADICVIMAPRLHRIPGDIVLRNKSRAALAALRLCRLRPASRRGGRQAPPREASDTKKARAHKPGGHQQSAGQKARAAHLARLAAKEKAAWRAHLARCVSCRARSGSR